MLKSHLADRLVQADRRYQREQALGWLLRAVPWGLSMFLLLIGLDVLFHFGSKTRVLLDLTCLGLAMGGLGVLIYFARYRRGSPEQIARILETRNPLLGSKLINWLQLRPQSESDDSVTGSLAKLSVESYSRQMDGEDFLALTSSPSRPREKKILWCALGVFTLFLLGFYPVSSVVLPRFIDPFGDHPPYSFTRIEILDPTKDGVVVSYNKPIIIKAGTSGHRPSDLYLSFFDPLHPSALKTIPMYDKGDVGFHQSIHQVTSNLVIFAHTKNQHSRSKQRRVTVELIPKVEKAWVKIIPPSYTGIEAKETPFNFKNLSALTGSLIQFRLQSNRPLASGLIRIPGGDVELKTSGEKEVTGIFSPNTSSRLEFAVRDIAQNLSQESLSASLTLTEDLPPDISIDSPASDGFVAEDFKVEVRLSASDDYGLKTLRVHRALNGRYSAPKVIPFETITRSASEMMPFDIQTLGVQPGDVISLFAEVVDTCPTPHLNRSRVLHLTVISTEEYNQSLRQQVDISDIQGKYTALLNEMQDLLDDQKKIAERSKELQDALKKNDASTQRAVQAELDRLLAKQAEVNQKLNLLAAKMEKFVRAKPLYDIEKELQDALTKRAADLRTSTGENDTALKEQLAQSAASAAGKSSPLSPLASLQSAAEKQLQQLGAVKEQTEAQVMPPLQDMSLINALVNDFNAIKYLHEVQTVAASQARAYEARKDLDEGDRLALNQLAATERQIGQALSSTMENLRKHAEAADKTFPNAAGSGRDLADLIEMRRLAPIATQTAGSMLAGDGASSADLAERLRAELAALFEDTQQQGGKMCESLDQRLKLQRLQTGPSTFQQMMESRKFGFGNGSGMTGQGDQGMGGLDGFSASPGSNAGIFGNETIGGGKGDASGGNNGQGGGPSDIRPLEIEKSGKFSGAQDIQRPSNNSGSEAIIDEYREVIDAYFNAVTK